MTKADNTRKETRGDLADVWRCDFTKKEGRDRGNIAKVMVEINRDLWAALIRRGTSLWTPEHE